jgi:hypothetical protein
MRSLLSIVALVTLMGCSTERTQLMLALATDLETPSVMDYARLRVFRIEGPDTVGYELSKLGWDLRSGVSLPGSLGLYSSTPSAIKVRILAEGYADFASTPVVVVTREAIVSLVPEETRFLRLGLVAACSPNPCTGTDTCIEGVCTSREIDSAALPSYAPTDDPSRDLVTALECDSGTSFVDTMTGAPMPMLGTTCASGTCREGTCIDL